MAVQRGGSIVYVEFHPEAPTDRVTNGRAAYEPDAPAIHLRQLVSRGLASLNERGEVVPELASEIPSMVNGGVSSDGLRVTWRLRPNLRWSDGTALTSSDVAHTCTVFRDVEPSPATAGFSTIGSISVPDTLTAVIEYDRPFHAYKLQFRHGLLQASSGQTMYPGFKHAPPRAACSGPFEIAEWNHADTVHLVRNPHFSKPERPLLDSIRIAYRNDVDEMRRMVLDGRADICPWLTQPREEELRELMSGGLRIGSGSSMFFNRMQINLGSTSGRPHPILADVRVRKAILLGTDRRRVTDAWSAGGLHSPTYVSTRPDYDSGVSCSPPVEWAFDRRSAASLLDESGWHRRGSSGLRDRDGTPLRLGVVTFGGYRQEENAALWVEELRDLGIDAYLDVLSEPDFFGTYPSSRVASGAFDLAYYDRGRDLPGIDEEMLAFYHSDSSPSAMNPSGRNSNRINASEIDRLLLRAQQSLSAEDRRDIYCEIAHMVSVELAAEAWSGFVPNFQFSNPKLKGWTDGERYTPFGHDAENWFISNTSAGTGDSVVVDLRSRRKRSGAES